MSGSQVAEMVDKTCRNLDEVRERCPLIHNITNYVVMNFTANALLALGASPVMAHAPEEVEEMVGLAGALVINIGTLSAPWVDAMLLASKAARERSIPSVLDPVGVGATRFRTETARRLLENAAFTAVRGNASEILALAGQDSITKGVDSTHAADEAAIVAMAMSRRYGAVVAVTGREDIVTDGTRTIRIENGHPLMGKVTGTGCAATAITAAFCAVEPDALAAAAGALVVFGIAGELAAQITPGPGTFQMLLLDALDAIAPADIRARAKIRFE